MLCEKTDKIEEESEIPCKLPPSFSPNPWPYPPRTPQDVYLLWQHYTYLYNLVTRSRSRPFDTNTPTSTPGSSPFAVMDIGPIEIIITDDDDEVDRNTNNQLVLNLRTEVSKPSAPEECHTAASDELIITEVVKNSSENDVSLTVCLPLRRKSRTSSDFHEEITLTKIVAPETDRSLADDSSHSRRSDERFLPADHQSHSLQPDSRSRTAGDQPCSQRSPQPNDCRYETEESAAASDHSDADSTGSSDTDSNSIDFWKEIVDNEDDLVYGKRVRCEQQNKDEPEPDETSALVSVEPSAPEPTKLSVLVPTEPSAPERLVTSGDGAPRWRIGDDVKNFVNYTSMSDDTSASSESSADSEDQKDDQTTDSGGSSDSSEDGDGKGESSDGNDDYFNVYEFSTNTRCKYVLDEEQLPALALQHSYEHSSSQNDEPEPRADPKKAPPQFRADLESTVGRSSETRSNLQPPERRHANDTISDLEEDSGMNSDIGKYVSETDVEPEPEVGSELRKLSKYERAATHSRLYRLLLKEEKQAQEGRADEEAAEVVPVCTAVRKESLTLPLANPYSADSVSSSSGINSPMSPIVNERLVGELVQSLLTWKKGAAFRKLPPEKLREAAIRSLQTETACTSRSSTPHSAEKMAACRGSKDSLYYPGFDICPSKAFKYLQSGRNTPTAWPKCPLVSHSESRDPLPRLTVSQDRSYKR